MTSDIRIRLSNIPCDNLNSDTIREKDKIAIDFTPKDLKEIEVVLKLATERSQDFDEQILYHGLIKHFNEAYIKWQEARDKKWQEEHPKAGGS